ncbi:dephospho-CoA kinase [Prosthecochloris sp. GSB1]|uniref:dephospho-CoA kinase n=1 Tax=Prosthecochloris sp. GSB1 TaxID=281093 RepID=UPI000B8C717D|nr:dephospho-CoA kinase [Prosthecochloris sp. GSB1]ASQ90434.1 dephospho-CoA kinase [Prosthecochloris sp. GSB1]
MGKKPFLLGVTGGLGSGKSTVCRMLACLGCAVFEADSAARELQLSDPEIIAGMKRLFGDSIYFLDSTGALQLDRKTVANRVFADSVLLERLNRLVHPGVFAAFGRAVSDAASEGVGILVKEAAILFESGGEKGLDAVAVVIADMDKRVERAMAKGMGSKAEIVKRIETQWPQEKLVEKADFVIDNNGSVLELEAATRKLHQDVLRRLSRS